MPRLSSAKRSDDNAHPVQLDEEQMLNLKSLIGFSAKRRDAEKEDSSCSTLSDSLKEHMAAEKNRIEKKMRRKATSAGSKATLMSGKSTMHSGRLQGFNRSQSFGDENMGANPSVISSVGDQSESAQDTEHHDSKYPEEDLDLNERYNEYTKKIDGMVQKYEYEAKYRAPPPLHFFGGGGHQHAKDKARRVHKSLKRDIETYQEAVNDRIKRQGVSLPEGEEEGFVETLDPAEAVIAGVLKLHKYRIGFGDGAEDEGGEDAHQSTINVQKAIQFLEDMPAHAHLGAKHES